MNKYKYIAYNADNYGCGYYRIKQPYSRIQDVIIKGSMDIIDLKEGIDIMILQRQFDSQVFINMIASMATKGTKTIFEIDDDLFHIEPTNIMAHKAYTQQPQTLHNFTMFMKFATAVTVSTEYLKKELSQYTDRPIFVLPNMIDFNIWNKFYNIRKEYMKYKDNKIIIGWAGSSSHLGDFIDVVEPLVKILQEYPNVYLKFVGENFGQFIEFDCVKHKIIHSKWGEVDKFGELLVDIDIGIIPLDYNKFNKSKSNLKFMEYSALAIPTVATDIEPYNEIVEGKTGYKIKGRNSLKWQNALRRLIRSAELRNIIGENARAYVLENYDIDKNIYKYNDVLEMVKTIENPVLPEVKLIEGDNVTQNS